MILDLSRLDLARLSPQAREAVTSLYWQQVAQQEAAEKQQQEQRRDPNRVVSVTYPEQLQVREGLYVDEPQMRP